MVGALRHAVGDDGPADLDVLGRKRRSPRFYQLKGNMHVNVVVDGKVERVDIRKGETWLLPGNTPHSPIRPEAGSVGLVMERVREEAPWRSSSGTALTATR